ncbi:DUF4169 family protein [Mesorhizobium sp. BR1-1-16]|uniref:DUF4169 family protein n=1 Tax=Mesorhizobium sp. BR1-1-16 TaxID=2876653 RepID=UPI001CCA2359|nr:DUF4169 family protein [Mesorhizobium sp. BR1-1-16]MBZ9937667.1 DUF4169 family protein [Mesorhizobium sp. BR1-1-16]
MTADIVNLNRFRKGKARAEKDAAATENRTRFGRTKAEKERDTIEAERETRRLDAHRREDPSDPSD